MKIFIASPARFVDCIGLFHRRAIAAAPLAMLLAGCTAPNAGDGPLGETSEDVVVCPGANIVQGIDVSVYQGNINWGQVAGAKDFAIARVSDGSFLDTKFAQNWSGMKAAGIIRGAYQFFEPGEDGATQANLLLSKMTGFGPGRSPANARYGGYRRPIAGGDHGADPQMGQHHPSRDGAEAAHLHRQILLGSRRTDQRLLELSARDRRVRKAQLPEHAERVEQLGDLAI